MRSIELHRDRQPISIESRRKCHSRSPGKIGWNCEPQVGGEGIVKKKWAINSAFMSMYAFASVLVVWVLFDYNMAFGPQLFPFLGTPGLATSATFTTGQAVIPAAASGMPALTFPMATLIFFQFVFAAITVIILADSLLVSVSS
jgi:ammonia channel protein AmtB